MQAPPKERLVPKFAGSCFQFAAFALLFASTAAQAASISYNTGSLGSSADGTNADAVTTGPGAVAAGDDLAAVYDNVLGHNTIIPYRPALNPAGANPFTVEFWAQPLTTDNDDAPVANRVATTSNRSGWVFFQRATGWNFRMYSGAGGGLGWDLTGGAAPLEEWSHVVATWDGSAARLYVNGLLADNENDSGASGAYNANPASSSAAGNFIVGSSDTASPFNGAVDEVAFYATALTEQQILSHFDAASGATAGAYHSLIRSDGALLQLSNNVVPEPSAVALLAVTAPLLLRRRASRRHG
jgi:hypothetical protein